MLNSLVIYYVLPNILVILSRILERLISVDDARAVGAVYATGAVVVFIGIFIGGSFLLSSIYYFRMLYENSIDEVYINSHEHRNISVNYYISCLDDCLWNSWINYLDNNISVNM